ncbi:Rz-like lysis system protein LysB [Rahnella contaminans]|uniref:Rz-like lysis system protein LysB n=1 Tax=Rahnella contaminans TaxID=2703882 RepID=UPI003C2ED7C3
MKAMLALLAGMALLIVILLLSNRSLQHDLNNAVQQHDALTVQLHQRDQLITELNQQMQQRADAELALRQDLSTAAQVMQSREQERQRSLHDNPQSRQWADAELPADVSRLHDRPAFSSASDYLHWLSGGQFLPGSVQPSAY